MPWAQQANLKGPKGDTGATGSAGAQGAKGDKGDPGIVAVGFAKITVSAIPPASPAVGDLWIDIS